MGAQRLCPGLKIYLVTWKDKTKRLKGGSGLVTISEHARLILGFNTTEHRDMVIQRGIIIRGEVYQARLFNLVAVRSHDLF